ncbi:MAG: glycosyltransferase [Candidatus Thermoplasmatota archaeon]|nr:glycosyltransferase [Candidatus Thermoplasmatota archaeon]
MDIAWFTDTWLPTRDGVVTSLQSFKKELEERGHRVYLFVPGTKNHDDLDENIFYYKGRTFHGYPSYRVPPLHSLLTRRTERHIARIQPDIIHSHGPAVMGVHAVKASRCSNAPLLFTYHTMLEDSLHFVTTSPLAQAIVGRLLPIWLRWYFHRCQGVIAPSRAAAQEISHYANTTVEVIPTGVDLERFRTADGTAVRERHGLDGPVILHVGRIVQEKNLDLLVQAAPHILDKQPDAMFVVVGTGPYADVVQRHVEQQGLTERFLFPGFVSDEDLPGYYAAADVFAFPSTYETQGIVAVEAMATGTSVVAAAARSLPELIQDGENGFLFPPGSAEALANTILKALDADVTTEAKQTAERFSRERCTERLIGYYERFL